MSDFVFTPEDKALLARLQDFIPEKVFDMHAHIHNVAHIENNPDSLTIHGVEQLAGGVTVDCCNDHRIAMMAAIAATRCEEPVTLLGADCVKKSYPNFWEDYEKLGGKVQREADT